MTPTSRQAPLPAPLPQLSSSEDAGCLGAPGLVFETWDSQNIDGRKRTKGPRRKLQAGVTLVFLNESKRLLEGSDGAGFVVVDIEDGIKLRYLQHILDLLGQA